VTGAARLAVLAAALESWAETGVAPVTDLRHFHLATWYFDPTRGVGGDPRIADDEELGVADPACFDCGTTTCAMGLAALLPELREQGLTLNRYGAPVYAYYVQFSAVRRFFKIDMDTALNLFKMESYPVEERGDPGAVARRIRAHLAEEARS
jgi:hypothetical protein